MYETGGLVPQNIDVARRLYAAAASHGMKEADDRLAVLGPVAQVSPITPAFPVTIAPAPKISVAAEPAGPVDTAKATSGGYALQIGAYKSQTDADAGWKAYKAKHAALLLGYSSDVQRADLGEKGAWYRLRIAGFGDREVASALCDRLKTEGGDCFLRK
jgi:cell division protein FtsN